MVAKVSTLLKTVKNVEDEASKVVRSLENTIDAIDAGIVEYNSSNPPASDATPEDLIRSTKVCITCTGKTCIKQPHLGGRVMDNKNAAFWIWVKGL